jgi:hypothetical protein
MCNNISQKCSRQPFYNVSLYRFLGLSRRGIDIMHMNVGGISLRSLDDMSIKEQKHYMTSVKNIASSGVVAFYADNYVHRFRRARMEADLPGYKLINTTVCAMGVCDVPRESMTVGELDVVCDQKTMEDPEFLRLMSLECASSVKDFTGADTLAKKYKISNWPPKPKPDDIEPHMRGKIMPIMH